MAPWLPRGPPGAKTGGPATRSGWASASQTAGRERGHGGRTGTRTPENTLPFPRWLFLVMYDRQPPGGHVPFTSSSYRAAGCPHSSRPCSLFRCSPSPQRAQRGGGGARPGFLPPHRGPALRRRVPWVTFSQPCPPPPQSQQRHGSMWGSGEHVVEHRAYPLLYILFFKKSFLTFGDLGSRPGAARWDSPEPLDLEVTSEFLPQAPAHRPPGGLGP